MPKGTLFRRLSPTAGHGVRDSISAMCLDQTTGSFCRSERFRNPHTAQPCLISRSRTSVVLRSLTSFLFPRVNSPFATSARRGTSGNAVLAEPSSVSRPPCPPSHSCSHSESSAPQLSSKRFRKGRTAMYSIAHIFTAFVYPVESLLLIPPISGAEKQAEDAGVRNFIPFLKTLQ